MNKQVSRVLSFFLKNLKTIFGRQHTMTHTAEDYEYIFVCQESVDALSSIHQITVTHIHGFSKLIPKTSQSQMSHIFSSVVLTILAKIYIFYLKPTTLCVIF